MRPRVEPPAWKTWELPEPHSGIDMHEWQDGRCAWCGYDGEQRRLVRDHCHLTGLIRGLLCSRCNTAEGTGPDETWGAWRRGDNPANALREFEIYSNHVGLTPLSSQGQIHWYSDAERIAWFTLAPKALAEGMPWPEDVPSLETATARRDAAYLKLNEAMSGWDFLGRSKRAAS